MSTVVNMQNQLAGISYDPVVPLWFIAGAAMIAALMGGYALYTRRWTMTWRLIPMTLLLTLLVNPQLVHTVRTPLPDHAVVVIDDTDSMHIAQRTKQRDQFLDQLRKEKTKISHLEWHEVTVTGARQTALIEALQKTISGIPATQRSAAILLTDGQIHDIPTTPDAIKDIAQRIGAPVHTVLFGSKNETDRRIVMTATPDFGLVGRDATLTVMVREHDAHEMELPTSLPLTVDIEGVLPYTLMVTPGVKKNIRIPLTRSGKTVVGLSVPPTHTEISPRNNRTATTIHGIRDRTKILLVSGKPSIGERMWRRTLKSDPSVELVHFTILRPPAKDDGTPLHELALIAFPVRELFEERLQDFDLIIFDRYTRQSLVPSMFLGRLVDYVRKGGALLVSAGPEFATSGSLSYSDLGDILPVKPTGRIIRSPFRPTLHEKGLRHPITADLFDMDTQVNSRSVAHSSPAWGQWLRYVETTPHGGHVLLQTPNRSPLLIVDRISKGRSAVLLSDTLWLWARGWDGGGPQTPLLRHLINWLMAEPTLEEDALTLSQHKHDGIPSVHVTRQHFSNTSPTSETVTVTRPDGSTFPLELSPTSPGQSRARFPVQQTGVWRVSDGQHQDAIGIGAETSPEHHALMATDTISAPLSKTSKGSVIWANNNTLPHLRLTSSRNDRTNDPGHITLRRNDVYTTHSTQLTPLFPLNIATAIIFLVFLGFAWWREGQTS